MDAALHSLLGDLYGPGIMVAVILVMVGLAVIPYWVEQADHWARDKPNTGAFHVWCIWLPIRLVRILLSPITFVLILLGIYGIAASGRDFFKDK